MGRIKQRRHYEERYRGNFFTTNLNALIGWGRRYSLFHYPFITACCGMEYMSAACGHWDFDRFGVGMTTFSPRQADMLFVVGTITQKEAPVLKTVYDQLVEPKWVIACGACAVSGGIYDNYAVVQGIDKIIPVDVYIPGCPPRPETILDAIDKLQDKIQHQKQDWRWKPKS
ncbi:MAG: NADH-quinone oxidoreductase subunit NuoB [Candidatus Aminicenantes bacterium]|nr:NADH-quinone oxidoreductase subunit NuoB [Candidatus Aminicenantes bacterium]